MKNIIQILEESGYLPEGIIYEGGLNRILQRIKDNHFAILTAFRNNFTYKENKTRNRELERELNSIRAGGIKLTGHWEEAPDGMSWEEAKKEGRVTDVEEESYFVGKPDWMDSDTFREKMIGLMKKFNQDAIVYGDENATYLLFRDGGKQQISSKTMPTIGKIAQAYSTIRNKKIPFVFEGTIQPSNNFHRMAMKARGLSWFTDV